MLYLFFHVVQSSMNLNIIINKGIKMLKMLVLMCFLSVSSFADHITVNNVTIQGSYSGECHKFMSCYLLARIEMLAWMKGGKSTRNRMVHIIIYVKKYKSLYRKTRTAKKSADTETIYKTACEDVNAGLVQARAKPLLAE